MNCYSSAPRRRRPIVSLALRSLLSAVLISSLAAAAPLDFLPSTTPSTFCEVNGRIRDAVFVDDHWFLAGEFDKARPWQSEPGDASEVTRRGLVRCTAAGDVTTWDAALAHTNVVDTDTRGLALSPDGSTLYVAGRFHTAGGVSRRHAAAFDVATASLASWDPQLGSRANGVLVQDDGNRVYIAGGFQTVGGTSQPLLAATDLNGALVPEFAPAIDNPDGFETVYDLKLSLDQQTLFIGGWFDTVEDADGLAQPRSSAAAVSAATGAATAFAPDLEDPNPNDPEVQVYELHILGPWIYLCGDWWVTEGIGDQVDQRNVNRFDPETGVVDRSFWVATDGGVQACDVDPLAEVLYVGGHFDVVNGASVKDLFAMSLSGGAVTDWTPGTNGIPGVWTMQLAAGKLIVGGTFTQAGGVDADHAAAFSVDRAATLVVGDTADLNEGDVAVQQRLIEPLGFSVALLDDNAAVGDELDTVDLGLISGTASSTTLGTLFRDAEAPLLVWKPYIYDEMAMTGPTPGVDYELTEIRAVEVIDGGHPLAAGLSGTLDIFSSDRTSTWGEPAADGRAIMRAETGETNLFVYAKDAARADSTPSPSCRVGLPLHRSAAAHLTVAGWQIFDRAVTWTTSSCEDTVFLDGFELGTLETWSSSAN